MDFVELGRWFAPITSDREPNVEYGLSWGAKYSGWLQWQELLAHRRVIVLAEASSGKTEEFRHQVRRLCERGEAAFFLRIEELADSDLVSALEIDASHLFQSWLQGEQDGWFFLDSVDEARLNQKSLERALKSLRREVGGALDRTRIFVSCRVSDWEGDQDKKLIQENLPAWKVSAIESSSQDDESELLEPIFPSSSKKTVPVAKEPVDPEKLLVVQLLSLSMDQCVSLATVAGIKEIAAFREALDQIGLAAYVGRPGDVLDLASYWKTFGRFGSFAEMLEHSTQTKLAEEKAHRPDNNLLPPDDARRGAEALAAALTLGKSFTIKAPSAPDDPSLTSGAIDAAQALGDWTPAKRNALLRRGIFAPATYGRIRFHHRGTQEYLTARWFDRLLSEGCPKQVIYRLIFVEQYGVKTIVPSLRAVAAWLSLWYPDVMAEVVSREPLTLIRSGDPGSLRLDDKKALLLRFAELHATDEIPDDNLDSRDLRLFADDGLAPALIEAWEINKRPDFQFTALRLIRDGRITGAISLARPIVEDQTASSNHRAVALQALSAAKDSVSLCRAAKLLTADPASLGERLAGEFAEELYPQYLSTDELLGVIRAAESGTEFEMRGFAQRLERLYRNAGSGTDRGKFVEGLGDLILSPPFKQEYHRVSARYGELADGIDAIIRDQIELLGDRAPSRGLLQLLMAAERNDSRSSFGEEKSLPDLVREKPQLSRALFWADVDEMRRNQPHERSLTRHWQIHVSSGQSFWALGNADMSEMEEKVLSNGATEDRQIALSVLASLFQATMSLKQIRVTLGSLIAGNSVLEQHLIELTQEPIDDPEERRMKREHAAYVKKDKEQEKRNRESWVNFRNSLRADPEQLSRSEALRSWKAGVFRLKDLVDWLSARVDDHGEKAALQWRLLRSAFSSAVAEAYRDGMIALWRSVTPAAPARRPSGTISYNWINLLAFYGLGIEANEDSDWAVRLTSEEALIAAAHACLCDDGYPKWLAQLIAAHPDVVLPIVAKRLKGEWAAKESFARDFIGHFAHADDITFPAPVQRQLLHVFSKAEAGHPAAVDQARRITVKLSLTDEQTKRLARTVKRRLRKYIPAAKAEYVLPYLAWLFTLDSLAAIPALGHWLESAPEGGKQQRAVAAFSALFDNRSAPLGEALELLPVHALAQLLDMAFSNIAPSGDLHHEGTYTPTTRDSAETGRETILSALMRKPGQDAYAALIRAADHPAFALRAERIRELSHEKAAREAELPAWSAREVSEFATTYIAPVKTGDDLYRVVLGLIGEIDFAIHSDDITSRASIQRATNEDEVRNWFVEQMNHRARGRFHAYREAQITHRDRPDIIIASATARCEVAVEVKHGGKGWTVEQLNDALTTQLAEGYLLPSTRRHGVLLITNHGDQSWRDPSTRKLIGFSELIASLSETASSLSVNSAGPIKVAACGLDLREGGRKGLRRK